MEFLINNGWIVGVLFLLVILAMSLRVLREYERAWCSCSAASGG
jgi:hypothetical protein